MSVGYQDIGIGSSSGDHTGDPGRTGALKLVSMLKELFGQAPNAFLSVTLTAASTDDYAPWGVGVQPPQDFILNINPTTNDVIITSLIAGFDGQRGTIINGGTGGHFITATNGAGTGTAANRFYGSGDGGAQQGGAIRLIYTLLPNPRWYMG